MKQCAKQSTGILKRVLTIALIISLLATSLIVSNAADVSGGTQEPPPELIILEGEEWIPDAVDPFLISPHGDEDECGHYGHPPKYRYIGAVKGRTYMDDIIVDTVAEIVTGWIPEPFNTIISLASKAFVIFDLLPSDKLEGDYVRYQYIYEIGSDPNMYWEHTFFQMATVNGQEVGSACYATFSPKKEPGQFQD